MQKKREEILSLLAGKTVIHTVNEILPDIYFFIFRKNTERVQQSNSVEDQC